MPLVGDLGRSLRLDRSPASGAAQTILQDDRVSSTSPASHSVHGTLAPGDVLDTSCTFASPDAPAGARGDACVAYVTYFPATADPMRMVRRPEK
jgi:hypothetical protein